MRTSDTMTTRQTNEMSGFGSPESASPVEVCPEEACYRDHAPLITDFYCHDHSRFLPLIGESVGTRAAIAIVMAIIGYGFVEWTAETGSAAAVYVMYSAIFLGLIAIPLRHFGRTAGVASLLWVIGSVVPFVVHATPGRFHVISAAVVVVVAATVLSIYALSYAVDWIPPAGTRAVLRYRVYGWDSSTVVAWVAGVLCVAAWSAIAGVVVRSEWHLLPGTESALSTVLLIIAAIAFGISALIVSVSGAIIGADVVPTTVPQFQGPRRPRRRSQTPRSLTRRSRGTRDTFGIIIETLAWVFASMVVAAGNMLVLIGLFAIHSAALACYVLARAMVMAANMIIRVAVITARWVRATMIIAVRISWHAVVAVWQGMTDVIVSVVVPVSALLGTPWIIAAAAGETRRYLLRGPLAALLLLFVLLLVAAVSTLGTWTILANQHPRESFMSAGRSIPVTIGYGVPVVLIGGWVLGIPGELGYGRIHLGPLTYALTAAAAIAVAAYFLRRQRAAQPAPSTAAYRPAVHGGRVWSIGIALAMIAGTIIGIAVFVPGRGASPGATPGGTPASRPTPTSPASTPRSRAPRSKAPRRLPPAPRAKTTAARHTEHASATTVAAAPTPPPPAPHDYVPPSTNPGQVPVPAGATILGSVDLAYYCRTTYPGHYAVLRFANAWGWRCAASPVPARGNRVGDLNVSVDAACAEQYGSGVHSHFRAYSAPNSWFCYRG